MSADKNMDDLMQAAQLKLQAQQKQQRLEAGEDIYADMRKEIEVDVDIDYPDTVIQRRPNTEQNEFDIQYSSDEYPEDYYIDPNDTPVFEGGPGLSQIDIWKKQFGLEKIFHTQILERHFVFRTLNRFEYKQIVGIENIDALYREEVICRTCVLYPYNYDFKQMAQEDSGYPSTLAQIIMENSGFTKEYGIEVL